MADVFGIIFGMLVHTVTVYQKVLVTAVKNIGTT